MRSRRMCRSADARGKCKYVKARPEFSYSRCPPATFPAAPIPALPSPSFSPRCIALTRCNCRPPPPRASLNRPASAARLRACASTCALEKDTHTYVCMCVCDTFFENVKIARARIESDSLSSSQPPSAASGFFCVAFIAEKGNARSPLPIDRSRSIGVTYKTRRTTRESCSPRNDRNVTLLFFFPPCDVQESLRIFRARFSYQTSRGNANTHTYTHTHVSRNFHSLRRAITCQHYIVISSFVFRIVFDRAIF